MVEQAQKETLGVIEWAEKEAREIVDYVENNDTIRKQRSFMKSYTASPGTPNAPSQIKLTSLCHILKSQGFTPVFIFTEVDSSMIDSGWEVGSVHAHIRISW